MTIRKALCEYLIDNHIRLEENLQTMTKAELNYTLELVKGKLTPVNGYIMCETHYTITRNLVTCELNSRSDNSYNDKFKHKTTGEIKSKKEWLNYSGISVSDFSKLIHNNIYLPVKEETKIVLSPVGKKKMARSGRASGLEQKRRRQDVIDENILLASERNKWFLSIKGYDTQHPEIIINLVWCYNTHASAVTQGNKFLRYREPFIGFNFTEFSVTNTGSMKVDGQDNPRYSFYLRQFYLQIRNLMRLSKKNRKAGK